MVQPGEPLHGFLAKVLGLLVVVGVVIYQVIRISYAYEAPGDEIKAGLSDLFVLIVTLLVVSPVLQPWHALWLLPLMVVRPSGIAWLALPTLVSLSYLTHLVGPDASDLTLGGGMLSFRVFEFGLFGVLLAVDHFSRRRVFHLRPTAVAVGTATEDEAAHGRATRTEAEVLTL
jgi:hypothetical protein